MAEQTQQQDWMTAVEAAAVLRVHPTTVREMCQRGELPSIKAGRDWRVSRSGLAEIQRFGAVHGDLVERVAQRAAALVTQQVMAAFAEGFRGVAVRAKYEGCGDAAARHPARPLSCQE
ncbi:MAG TPA: helix-turn-helix domain-containing protein [Armatimonadota bacterium]|nr:helix-turn-helix domain-containing protein [Armatimonadota bacterium]